MSFDLNSIRKGVEHKAPRIVLLGVQKIGKSTFAAGSDNPIFLPIKGEEGVDDLDVAKFPRAETFDDVLAAVTTLIREEHDYKTFVIDSVSALEPVIWAKLCDEDNVDSIESYQKGFGKGYTAAANKMRDLMEGLDRLRSKGISVILIGHVKVKRFDDPLGPSFDQYQFDLHERIQLALERWADSILFANSETIVKTEELGFNKEKKTGKDLTGARYLFTLKRPGHPGGGRGVYGRLPYKLPLEWEAFANAASDAAQTTTK
tara:strand:- start:3494 stop:4276 length:783 start_codon:yes stop_codon:yes gene_type:complete